ncbi:DUF3742 family protein [Pseudomonas sp. MOIL14HWK12:I2]|uniref:DUF3742 family protein n=1 Tax=Pseudomonas sp. MOIL14HWK12:I2 TaxID=1033994 RepID=UPI0009FF40F0
MRKSAANSIGQGLGKLVVGLLSLESRFFTMLCGGGVPTAMAARLKWLLRIAVVGGIAFLSLGLFFIVGCLLVAVFALKLISSSNADDSSQNSASIQSVGWKDGDQGYGFYDAFGVRDHNVK